MLLRFVIILTCAKNILAKRFTSFTIPSLAQLVPYGNPLCGCFRGLQKYCRMLFADKRIYSHSDQPRSKVSLLLFFCIFTNYKKSRAKLPLHLSARVKRASPIKSGSETSFLSEAKEQGVMQIFFFHLKIEEK